MNCGSPTAPNLDREVEEDEEENVVYTDGSALFNGQENARAGAGIFYGLNDNRNRAIRVPSELPQTNQVGELLAVIIAAQDNPKDIPLKILSDSRTTIEGLTKHLTQWEAEDFRLTENGKLFKVAIARLRERSAPTLFEWVKGHSGDAGNDGADKLAGEGALKADNSDALDLEITPSLRLPGAQLSRMSQSRIYKIIQQNKGSTPQIKIKRDRRDTRRNVALAQEAATDAKGNIPTAKLIWKGARNKVFSRNIRYFMWMILHNGYKVGEYWTKIPAFGERAECTHCGTEETMEHILTECATSGQADIRELVSELWKKRTGKTIQLTFADILACGATKILRANGKTDPALTRLYRIVVSESAYLIWRLRCEYRINRGGLDPATEQEIRNRWLTQIKMRVELDKGLTDKKWGKKSLPLKLARATWWRVIRNIDALGSDHTGTAGLQVLVGTAEGD